MNRRTRSRTGIFIALLLWLSACASAPQSVRFDGVTYSGRQVSGSTETYTSPTGQVLTIQRGEDTTQVSAGGQVYQVRGEPNRFEVTLPDGRALARQVDASGGSAGMTEPGIEVSFADWDRVDELREIVFQTGRSQQMNASLGQYLLAAVLFALGLLELLNPRLAWQIAEGWRYANVEPSDLYLGVSRLAGVLLMVIALFLAFSA